MTQATSIGIMALSLGLIISAIGNFKRDKEIENLTNRVQQLERQQSISNEAINKLADHDLRLVNDLNSIVNILEKQKK